jgi:hypothetical protein
LLVIGVLLIVGFLQAHPIGLRGISTTNLFEFIGIPNKRLYKPGDNLGFNIGLIGGLMMVTLLIYPLRKRFTFMRRFGLLPKWFKWHMIFGILGPTLILFHSTFVIHSTNAGVAMISMLLVGGSGVFGRFFYTKIHRGLYGRQITLKGMQEEMAKTGSFNRSFLMVAPELEHSLDQFRARTEKMQGGFLDFFSIGIQSALLARSLTENLRKVMVAQAQEKQGNTAANKQNVDELHAEYATHIRTYIKTVRDAAQFRTYERLFSLWHVFHIPLVYMLVFSGIYHVIAVVYMY